MCDPTQQTQALTQAAANLYPGSSLDDIEATAVCWARLLPSQAGFKAIDLTDDVTSFGRGKDCDIVYQSDSKQCAVSAYSNVHFKIKREFSIKIGTHALLEDCSSNGTFIDGEKLGKGRVQALKNNNEISLAKPENRAYIFIDLSNKEDTNLPPQIKINYTITKTLGVGAYGQVKLAFEKNTCEKCAIKIIQKKKFTINGRNNHPNTQILSEVNILKKLEHPCIIQIKEVIDTPDTVYIVLELVEGGELFDKVVSIGQYNESSAKLLFYQMVLAIKYLHDQGISHRDLKPENILLSSADTQDTLIKVTDFGLSKFFNTTSIMKTFCGTPNYLAPEVLQTKGEGSYTNKIDNWSLGVILYILLVGYPPFSEENTQVSLEKQITRGMYEFPKEFWSNVSGDAIDLVKKLMCVDPVKRASLEQVLEHRWIKYDAKMKEKAERLMYPNRSSSSSDSGSVTPSGVETRSKKAAPNGQSTNAKKLKTAHSNTTDKSNDSI